VTQEDFVHPMAVIEQLWRSCCCTPKTEAPSGQCGGNIGLSARLKVRQWTQLLIEQSLLLGSSSKGVHLHDIVLTYLRGSRSASELRALQKRVVEGLVTAATERTVATGRGFQDTGSTAKAFEGEEVDWYVCNVASYHVKQAMDASLALVENEDLKRWLMLDDETVVRAAAVAVGMAGLESLVAHFSAVEAWVEGAKVERAMSMVSAGSVDRVEHAKAALDLLEKAESTATPVQQLELDIRGGLGFDMRTGPAKKHNTGRMQALMGSNESLRIEPMGLYMTSVFPQLFALFGMHPAYWNAGKIATQDTVRDGLRLQIFEGMPLCAKAAEESVGARKECIRITYVLCSSAMSMMLRSTDETAEMHQQLLEAKWGKDGSVLAAGCMDYRFDRHFMITQGFGTVIDNSLSTVHARGVAEYCGDVQQMVQLFEKQLDGMREFVKRGVPGTELPVYVIYTQPAASWAWS
jgi:hypothetical protein